MSQAITINHSIKDIRRYLHQHPELSGEERSTSILITKLMADLEWFTRIHEFKNTGILCEYDTKKPGPAVLFRCEIDALPIQEENNFHHRSHTDGISHKCGHDGHMAILIGLAKQLKSKPIQSGKIYLLFQPAEETGEGAAEVLQQAVFKDLKIDFVFALHNLPGFQQGAIVAKRDVFNASVKSVIITLEGKTSHASEPEHGNNPSLAIADLLLAFNELSQPDTSKEDFRLLTPVHVNIGKKAYGVSAGKGELHLTVRSWGESQMKKLIDKIEKTAQSTATKYKLKCSFEYLQSFASNYNDEKGVQFVEKAARTLGLPVIIPEVPFKWGEDFGLFTNKYKGCMFGLGAGERMPALHNPDYDFPDEILETGVDMFNQIVHLIYQ